MQDLFGNEIKVGQKVALLLAGGGSRTATMNKAVVTGFKTRADGVWVEVEYGTGAWGHSKRTLPNKIVVVPQ